MASTKCPSCGRQNFTTAIVCRHCSCPLLGEAPRPRNLSSTPVRKESFRWVLNASLISVAFAVLLFFVVFLVNVIPNAMHSSETGWTDFTESQKEAMLRWYLTLLGIAVVVVFTVFYRRRHKHD
jgi:hypothetical protein